MGRIVLSHTATNLDVRTDGYRTLEMTRISGEWPGVPYQITSVQVIFGQISAYSLKRSLEVYCNSEGVNALLVRTAALGAYLGATGTVYRGVTFQCAANLNYPALDVINLKCHNESGASGTGAGFKIYAGSTVQLVIDYELTFQVSPFSLDKSTMDMGQTVTATIPANDVNSGFTHTATLSLGGQSISASRTGPGTLALTVPASWYSLLPASVSGTATVTVTTAGVGQTGSAAQSLTLTIPASVKPTAGTLTAEGISQYWGLYVQGVSRAKLTASGYAAGAGASGVSVSIAGGGYSGTGASLTTGALKTAGAVTFTATVMDSRGRTATATVSLTVTAYSAPQITSLTARRCAADGTVDEAAGTYVKITLGYEWSAIGSNAIDGDIYIGGTKTNEGVALPASGEAFPTAFGGELAIAAAYPIKVMVYDGIHTREAGGSISAEAVLQSVKRILNFYPSADSGIGIGQMATAEKRVELAEDWGLWAGGRDLTGNSHHYDSSRGNALSEWTGSGITHDFYHPDHRLGASQPSAYGNMLNIGTGAEISQLWFAHALGSMYHRQGNVSGWSGSAGEADGWREIADQDNLRNMLQGLLAASPLGVSYGGTGAGSALAGLAALLHRGSSANADTAKSLGIYTVSPDTANLPVAGYGALVCILNTGEAQNDAANWLWQFFLPTNFDALYWRSKINEYAFTGWGKFAFSLV